MRWFSSLAILVYLSLLCSPQALAGHDSRLSPLADTQLQGLNPAIYSAFNHATVTPDDTEQEPHFGLIASSKTSCYQPELGIQPTMAYGFLTAIINAHQPRAPPIYLSQ